MLRLHNPRRGKCRYAENAYVQPDISGSDLRPESICPLFVGQVAPVRIT